MRAGSKLSVSADNSFLVRRMVIKDIYKLLDHSTISTTQKVFNRFTSHWMNPMKRYSHTNMYYEFAMSKKILLYLTENLDTFVEFSQRCHHRNIVSFKRKLVVFTGEKKALNLIDSTKTIKN